ncbi:MAG: hypothetical protein ROO76_04780 [Terriglobia bacterium]|jgi:hypothetical protein|nr:hypothetical protein [Terriglobia bacterium]
MKRAIVVVVIVMCLVSLVAFAEDATKVPKYIWVQNVTVAGDKAESYRGLVGQYRRAVDTVKSDSYWITASSLTGDLRQLTFVSFYNSMAAAEKDFADPAISAEVKRVNPNFWTETGAAELEPRGSVAVYREDLSFQPGKVPPPEVKWWRIKTIHVKPGYRTAFADLMKEEIELLNNAKVDEHFAVYEVIAGVPTTGQVYYIVTQMKSLGEMDADYSEQMKPFVTPVIREHLEAVVQKIVTRVEDNLLMVRPDLSRAPQAFLAANPVFWTIKEPETVAAKGKAKAKKPAKEAESIPPKLDKN